MPTLAIRISGTGTVNLAGMVNIYVLGFLISTAVQ